MPQTQLRPPALVTRDGLGDRFCSAAPTGFEFSARTAYDQSATVQMIARRFRVHPATALAHVEAFGFGGRR